MRGEFSREQRGVSPVIAVILMVAITVILSAVIASFVLDVGGSLQESAPQATFSFEQEQMDIDPNRPKEYTIVTITHEGGESVHSSNLKTTVNGGTPVGVRPGQTGFYNSGKGAINPWDTADGEPYTESEISAGDQYHIALGGPGIDGAYGAHGSRSVTNKQGDGYEVAFDHTPGGRLLRSNGSPGELLESDGYQLEAGDEIQLAWTGDSGSGTLLASYEVAES